jgi:hypothetical protein
MSESHAGAALQENPARHDALLGNIANVPANPLPVAIAAAQFPAAIQPSQIQILSGVSHSSSRKKRTLELAGLPPSVAPRNPADVLEIFLSTQESESLRANTAAITSSLASLKDMPDCEQKRQIMNFAYAGLAANIQRLSSSASNVSPAPPVPQNNALVCAICREDIVHLPARSTYVDATFTRCGHAFHNACLSSHRRIGGVQKDNCPVCRDSLFGNGRFDHLAPPPAPPLAPPPDSD